MQPLELINGVWKWKWKHDPPSPIPYSGLRKGPDLLFEAGNDVSHGKWQHMHSCRLPTIAGK